MKIFVYILVMFNLNEYLFDFEFIFDWVKNYSSVEYSIYIVV